MAHAQHTVTINRPITDVFAYLADGTNNPHWRPGVVEILRTSATDGPDATYRQILAGPGGR
ncbi:MAG: SRPBCC family protein, partial [Betaproteobacteria bacterium]